METSAMVRSLLSVASPLCSAHSHPEPRSSPSLALRAKRSQSLALSTLTVRSSAAGLENRSRLVTRCSVDGAVKTEAEAPIEKRFPPFPSVMDINQIRNILPHRFPFLLVDRLIEYTPGVTAVGIKNVTINDNFFPGHFPERPIIARSSHG